MPRPLSETYITFPGKSFTTILVQTPARASSMALSTISYTRWCRPLGPVEPMYMPGRLRTASRPSSTCIWSLLYISSVFVISVISLMSKSNSPPTQLSCVLCQILPYLISYIIAYFQGFVKPTGITARRRLWYGFVPGAYAVNIPEFACCPYMPHLGPWYQSQPCEAAASGLKPDADVPAAGYRQHLAVLLAGLYAARLS